MQQTNLIITETMNKRKKLVTPRKVVNTPKRTVVTADCERIKSTGQLSLTREKHRKAAMSE